MQLSDYIKALQHVQATHGDLQILERRLVWYDTTELFPYAIEVDNHVTTVERYMASDGKHHWQLPGHGYGKQQDLATLRAYVIENGIGKPHV